jgi:hypothetical protein
MGRQAPDGLLGVHMNLLVTTLGGAMLPAESRQERAAADAIAMFRTSGFGGVGAAAMWLTFVGVRGAGRSYVAYAG